MRLISLLRDSFSRGPESAKAIDLDGTNDYFSRASDLTGNADGKTFTFSAWVYSTQAGGDEGIYISGTTSGSEDRIYIAQADGSLTIMGTNSSGVQIFGFVTVTKTLPMNTWSHLLCSIDLTNSANRHVYINDSSVSGTWSPYTNTNIDFTTGFHYVGGKGSASRTVRGRLAHVYLDYTYRDLSNSANRRLFITADLKPAAGQAALNPIIYLPMDDPATAHVNQGTGGNFTLNGTIARSGRGPNQYNVAYSDLDGAADYLNSTSVTGLSDGGVFSIHCAFTQDSAGTQYILDNGYFRLYTNAGNLYLIGYTSAAAELLRVTLLTGVVVGRNYILDISIDLSNVSKRHVYVNGLAASVTWTTYTSGNLDFTRANLYVGGDGSTGYWNGKLGSVFFHTGYIDLSVAANLAKFVTGTGIDAKPVDLGADGSTPLGVQPLIYLPMYGNNAGKNYGSGGDFTVNSGPYTGSKGPNENWGNLLDFTTTGYLYNTPGSAFSTLTAVNRISFSFFYKNTTANGPNYIFCISGPSGSNFHRFEVYAQAGSGIYFDVRTNAGAVHLSFYSSASITQNTLYHYCGNINLTTATATLYRDGVSQSITYTNQNTNGLVDFSTSTYYGIGGIIRDDVRNHNTYAQYSEVFWTTENIDFTQESIRLKFRDPFNNPIYLGPDGSAPTGIRPQVYSRLIYGSHGDNFGTANGFAAVGSFADAGQF